MPRIHPFPLLFAITAGLALGPSPEQAATGTIAGRVTLTTRVRSGRLPSNAYPTRRVGPAAAVSPEIRNVVVYLKDPGFRGTLGTTVSELKQENEAFEPHVIAITRGSSVSFLNADPFFHNVFSLSGAAEFDLGRYPKGQTRTWKFPKAGLVKVFCHIHSHMTATIMVLDHPYFAIPGNDGTFELRNVPAGDYTLIGWHERVGERSTRVRVESGKTATVDISLPVEDAR